MHILFNHHNSSLTSPCFTDEYSEAQRHWEYCSVQSSWWQQWEAEAGFQFRLVRLHDPRPPSSCCVSPSHWQHSQCLYLARITSIIKTLTHALSFEGESLHVKRPNQADLIWFSLSVCLAQHEHRRHSTYMCYHCCCPVILLCLTPGIPFLPASTTILTPTVHWLHLTLRPQSSQKLPYFPLGPIEIV